MRVWEFWSSKSWPVKSYTVQHYKLFVTASTSTPVFLSMLPWSYDAGMSIANSLHTSA